VHRVAKPGASLFLVTPLNRATLNNPNQRRRVYLKVVPALVRNGRSPNRYAILDDGAERTIILPVAAQHLNLRGKEESFALRTINLCLRYSLRVQLWIELST
jgi:hypothetical protein